MRAWLNHNGLPRLVVRLSGPWIIHLLRIRDVSGCVPEARPFTEPGKERDVLAPDIRISHRLRAGRQLNQQEKEHRD